MTDYLPYTQDEEELLRVDSSAEDVGIFLDTVLHKDFQREVNIRIEMLTKMMDDPHMKHSLREYDLFRGGKRALIEMRDIFIDMKNGLTENIIKEKEHEEI